MKFKLLIVDDEESGRKSLKILLEKLFWVHTERLELCNSFESARDRVLEQEFDIIFLDINLRKISAFGLLEFISSSTRVVFVTAYSEFMLQALRSKAFDYLLKPVKEADIQACLDRILKDRSEKLMSATITLRLKGFTRFVPISDILYIEGSGPYSIFQLKNEVIKTARTIKSVQPDLADHFIRIHKSYLVNRHYIRGYNTEHLILLNNTCLPVSRSGYKLLSAL